MVANSIRELLEQLLEKGAFRIGQIQVSPDLELRHVGDAAIANLPIQTSSRNARELAIYDDAGKYRPLKSAPNLRHGWSLKLASITELHLALDSFYPAALGNWLEFLKEQIQAGPLRATLARQTGMYRVVGLITDEQIRELVQTTCAPSACLRRMLWATEPGKPHEFTESAEDIQNVESEIPILCVEACNLFIAEGRKIVKAAQK